MPRASSLRLPSLTPAQHRPVTADLANGEPGEQFLGVPPVGAGTHDHRAVLRLTVREPGQVRRIPPHAYRALPADRRLTDAETGEQTGRGGEFAGHRRARPPEGEHFR